MSKFDIRPEFECQNRILNVKMRYSARIRMLKNEKRKAKNEKRKTKSKLTSPLIEYRKTKNEKQTNFTLLSYRPSYLEIIGKQLDQTLLVSVSVLFGFDWAVSILGGWKGALFGLPCVLKVQNYLSKVQIDHPILEM